jgi:hypothetical protein
VGVGYDRAHFVTAQAEIPLAPKINATFFDPFIAILLLFKYVEETSMSAGGVGFYHCSLTGGA